MVLLNKYSVYCVCLLAVVLNQFMFCLTNTSEIQQFVQALWSSCLFSQLLQIMVRLMAIKGSDQ